MKFCYKLKSKFYVKKHVDFLRKIQVYVTPPTAFISKLQHFILESLTNGSYESQKRVALQSGYTE